MGNNVTTATIEDNNDGTDDSRSRFVMTIFDDKNELYQQQKQL